MEIEFIDSQLPIGYSEPVPASELEQVKEYNGKTYKLFGISQKNSPFYNRIWLGLSSLVKIVFSLVISNLSEGAREDWNGFWNGKKIVVIYKASNSPKEAKDDDVLVEQEVKQTKILDKVEYVTDKIINFDNEKTTVSGVDYINNLFKEYQEQESFREVSASDCHTTLGSIKTVLQGLRPIALLPGVEYWPEGMKENLEKHHISIIEEVAFQSESADDLVIKKDWTGENQTYSKTTSWIIFREGHNARAQALLDAQLLVNPVDRHRRMGEALNYRKDDIDEFIRTKILPRN